MVPLAEVSRRGLAWLALAVAVALPAGCATSDWALLSSSLKPPPICNVVATWKNSVLYTPDPVHNGKMSPGLAARVHLFGADMTYPMLGDGGLVFELHDDSSGKEPVFLERWEIDPATMKRLSKRDMIGWGYTVYLPWTRTSPDVTKLSKVRMRVRYQPAAGSPLFTESQVTLAAGNGDVRSQTGPPMALPQIQAKR